MIAVKSIEPLRNVVGSKDQSLYDSLLKSAKQQLETEYGRNSDDDDFQEQLDETKAELQRMILKSPPPKTEPGCWIYLIRDIVKAQKLEIKVNFPFNKGYKHSYVWQQYRTLVSSRLTKAALEALRHLEIGRPLHGKKIDYDGCVFAWLTQPEIAALHESLSKIPDANVGDKELEEFHADVVAALAALKKKKCDLVLGAH